MRAYASVREGGFLGSIVTAGGSKTPRGPLGRSSLRIYCGQRTCRIAKRLQSAPEGGGNLAGNTQSLTIKSCSPILEAALRAPTKKKVEP